MAIWSNREQFKTILIHPRMLIDHLPDKLLKAIRKLFAHELNFSEYQIKSDGEPFERFRKLATM